MQNEKMTESANKQDTDKTDIDETVADISKYLTIIIVVHSLFCLMDNNHEILDEMSLKLMFFVSISLIIYNFLIKKIII